MSTQFTPFFQQVDSNGAPLSGAKLYFYQTGTSTPLNTYTTSALTTPNANPVVADANGRWGPIYLGTSSDYKVILKDSADVTIATVDPVFAGATSGRTTVSDVNYTATVSDRLIAYTSLTAARVVALPAASDFPGSTLLIIVDESGSASIEASKTIAVSPHGADLINGANANHTVIAVAYGSAMLESDGSSKWTVVRDDSTRVQWAGVRQTVAAGPVTSAGLPNFLPATSTGLTITSQNVTSSAPLAASSANGWSATTGLPVDMVGYSTSNLTWGSLTNTTTNYLYATVNADGTLTPASTTVAPVYQWGGTPSTTSGTITFNIGEMKAYLGNGTTAPQAYVVVFGEAVTSGGNVTSTVAYAYNGKYESAFTATLPSAGSATSANHNIGVEPRLLDFIIQNTTTDGGYAVGDQVHYASLYGDDGVSKLRPSLVGTAKAMTMIVPSSHGFSAINKGTGADQNLTLASWKYKFVAARGW